MRLSRGWFSNIERLAEKRPCKEEDGRLVPREKGTPQGGVISPLLSNLFLHFALDRWLGVNYPQVPFERYADDVIVHCETERQAEDVRQASLRDCEIVGWNSIRRRRKIVYCKALRRIPMRKFDFWV